MLKLKGIMIEAHKITNGVDFLNLCHFINSLNMVSGCSCLRVAYGLFFKWKLTLKFSLPTLGHAILPFTPAITRAL